MFCAKCSKHVTECDCGDIEERLAELAEHPNFATDRCANCREHAQDCECEEYEPL